MPYGLEQLMGPHTGGQYAGAMAATTTDAMGGAVASDTATPMTANAATPGGRGSKASQVAKDPTLWLVITLGAGLALYWYSAGQLKVSV